VQGRTYCVQAPTKVQPHLPVVLVLHGFGSNGDSQAHYFGLDDRVDPRGFLLVKPNGTRNSGGQRYWNVSGPDDVSYLSAVLDDVLAAYGGDPRRLLVVGHSNGGFMAHRLACERSERIAAIVSLAGAVYPALCHPSQPVSILDVRGTADPLVKYEGGTLLRLGPYVSAVTTVDFWARADGCQPAHRSQPSRGLLCSSSSDHPETAVESYSGCPAGISVEQWRQDGVGHIPNFALPGWPDAVLDFLLAHPKP